MDRSDLSVAEAAAILNCHEKTVRRRIKDGTLTARRIKTPQGFEWRVDLDHVDSPAVEVSGPEHDPDESTSTALALVQPVQLDSPERTELLRVIRDQAEKIGYLKALLEQERRRVQLDSPESTPPRKPWWKWW
jgi:excisionase family DNA binding protein